jgi:putative membrane protein
MSLLSIERWLLTATTTLVSTLLASGLHPYDRTTWLLEVAPILIVLPVLIATYRRFPLTAMLYACIFIHALILIAGGHYTYARVPLGYWMQDMLSLTRNPYDKIGHFAQGFVPFLVAREIFLRGGYVTGRSMTGFLAVAVVMLVSSSYELIEWWSALALGQGADEFLGTQGDPWDTQSDMFFALIGAITAWLALTSLQDRQISTMSEK